MNKRQALKVKRGWWIHNDHLRLDVKVVDVIKEGAAGRFPMFSMRGNGTGHEPPTTYRLFSLIDEAPDWAGYWTADEAAGCLSVGQDLSARLWELKSAVAPAKRRPVGGTPGETRTDGEPVTEIPDHHGEGEDTLAAIWQRLTRAERDEIRAGYAKDFGDVEFDK